MLSDIIYSPEFFKICIRISKTDLTEVGQFIILPLKRGKLNPFTIFCTYFQMMGSDNYEESYLFPSMLLDKNEKMWKPNTNGKLSYSSAYLGFKSLINKCGFDSKKFGLHSLRSGGTTELFCRNVPSRFIDKQGCWKSQILNICRLGMN